MANKYKNIVHKQIFERMERVPNIPKDVWGKEYTSECVCGGTITAIRSTYNGHLHARCDKCGYKLME